MAYKFNPFTGKLEEYGPVLTGTGTVSAAADGTAGAPGIAFANDLNTGIYRPGSDQIAISTGGTARLFVDASGNVGVGTSSPATKLEVAGGTTLAARFTITGNNNPSGDGVVASFGAGGPGDPAVTKGAYVNVGASSVGNVYFGCDSGYPGIIRIKTDFPGTRDLITIDPAGSIAFLPAGNERLRITGAGNVGIGTTSPQGLLSIYKGSTAAGIARATRYSLPFADGGNNGISIEIGREGNNSNVGAAIQMAVANYSGSSASYIAFRTSAATVDTSTDTSQERVRIDDSGRLLVGTSSARSNFFNTSWTPRSQIEGTSDTTSAQALICNSSDIYSSSIQFAKSRGATIGSNTVVQANDYLGSIGFQGSDGTEFVSGASIEAFVDGTPGANDMPTRLVFSTTADGASSPTERMRISNAGGSAHFATQSGAGSAVLEINASSGAGTTDYLLWATHSATTVFTGTVALRAYTNGNVQNINNSYGAISDVKFKENIVNAGSQWSDIKSLQVRKYNFKEETGQQTHTQIGLIAQEVELVSPGLVNESPDRDDEGNDLGTVTKSVNYSVLYMKAVKALQEAMERIEALEADVAQLKSA
jgi:hypothetical protein